MSNRILYLVNGNFSVISSGDSQFLQIIERTRQSAITSERLRCWQVVGRISTHFAIDICSYRHLIESDLCPSHYDCVVALKIGSGTLKAFEGMLEALFEKLARARALIFDTCDPLHLSGRDTVREFQTRLFGLATAVSVPTDAMRDHLRPRFHQVVETIPEPVEGPRGSATPRADNERVEVLWFGWMDKNRAARLSSLMNAERSEARAVSLTIMSQIDKRTFASSGLAQHFNANCAFARNGGRLVLSRYSEASLYQAMKKTHFSLIPHNPDSIDVLKSPNRAVSSLQGGVVPIATLIPSYRVLEDAIIALRDETYYDIVSTFDFDENARRVAVGQGIIDGNFSEERIVEKWVSLISRTLARPSASMS